MKRVRVILSVVAMALLATFALDLAQGEPFVATPDWSRTITEEFGQEMVFVEWDGGAGFVAFDEATRGASKTQIRVSEDAVHLDWITGTTYLIAAGIGLLLGFVVDLSLAGYGYVRGTGRTSETPDLDVGEERGFYWRT